MEDLIKCSGYGQSLMALRTKPAESLESHNTWTILQFLTGRSSEAERGVWDAEAGIAKFPAQTRKVCFG